MSESDSRFASGPAHLDLKDADRDSASYRRADDETTVIERWHTFEYRVRLGGGGIHTARLYRQQGQLHGRCDCRGFEYSEPPCAHLWALILAAGEDMITVESLEAGCDPSPECPTCGTVPPGGEPS